MITGRELQRNEIARIWEIDRRERIDNIYYDENGQLVLRPEHWELHGWPPGEAEMYTPHLLDCFDGGGWFYGLFAGEKLVGVAVLESRFIGNEAGRLQLKFLHVSAAYRCQGLGTRLFELARLQARRMGARQMYISATPSENTVHFYLRLGCEIAGVPDPELFELEPQDIHLVCEVDR